jgi:hypothetical protein
MSFADMEKWRELFREREWARQLINKLAPNARPAEWWFTIEPLDIIACEVMSRKKSKIVQDAGDIHI